MLNFVYSKEKKSDKDNNDLVNQIKVGPRSIVWALLKIFKKMFKNLENGGEHAIWFEGFINSLVIKN